MTRAFGLVKAFAGALTFFAFFLAGHMFDGSAGLDARELFNATCGLLAAAAMHVVVEGPRATFARRVALVATAAAPLVLAFAQAQSFGTLVGVARAAQWLAFACLGQGLGLIGAEGPEQPSRARPQAIALSLAVALGAALVALWAGQALPKWATLGSAITFFGVGLALLAPALGQQLRSAITLRGVLPVLALGLALFFVEAADPASGRLFFTSLAFAAGWAEGRLPRPASG